MPEGDINGRVFQQSCRQRARVPTLGKAERYAISEPLNSIVLNVGSIERLARKEEGYGTHEHRGSACYTRYWR